jgi:dihydroorotase
MEYAAGQGLTVHYQAMDAALQANGCINEGLAATRMGLIGIPNAAETAAVAVCLALIEHTGARVHFGRLSTQHAVRMLELAHSEGAQVSADVAAHHLFLCDDDIPAFDPNFHLLPPLRSASDLIGLRQSISKPVFSAICSDHQPHGADAKLAPFASTLAGASTLETLLSLVLRLVDEDLLSLQQAIALVTYKPAQMLNIDAGSLTAGAVADLCLFDREQEWVLQADTMQSRGKHSPFLEQRFKGKVRYTFVSGQLVYSESS